MAIYTFDFERKIMNEIDQMGRMNKYQPIFLGGIEGPNGGTPTGPITIIGQLPQSKVTFDTTEGTGSGISPSGSLVHNLNRIRGGYAIGNGAILPRHLSFDIMSRFHPGNTAIVAGSGGDYSTIQAGVDYVFGLGGGTVIIYPGTYVENVTLKTNVNIVALGDAVLAPSSGVALTAPASGANYIYDLFINGATGQPCLSYPTGSSALIALINVYLTASSSAVNVISGGSSSGRLFFVGSKAVVGNIVTPNGINEFDGGQVTHNVTMASGCAFNNLPKILGTVTGSFTGLYEDSNGKIKGTGFIFTSLADVPNSYTGNGLKIPRVKQDLSGLEFVTMSGFSNIVFTSLADVPNNYTGSALKVVRVKSDQTGLEFVTASGGTGAGATAFTQLTDVPANYTNGSLKVVRVKEDQTGLEFTAPSGVKFIQLLDTPTSYAGQTLKVPRVNAAENALEFTTISGLGNIAFTNLIDVPANYTGGALKVVRVKSTEDGLEFALASGGGGSTNPGGSNAQIQYNSSGSFAGSANLIFDGTSVVTLHNPSTVDGTNSQIEISANDSQLILYASYHSSGGSNESIQVKGYNADMQIGTWTNNDVTLVRNGASYLAMASGVMTIEATEIDFHNAAGGNYGQLIFAATGSNKVITLPDLTGTVALGAGTLTVSSTNSVTTASHTHSVTSSSNPGAAASILATDSSGNLTIAGILTESNTTDSTSTSTGAIVTDGGIGVAKQLTVGTLLGVGRAPSISGAIIDAAVSNAGAASVIAFTNTASAATGNQAGVQLRANTSVAERAMVAMYANFTTTTDASRASQLIIQTQSGGAIATSLTIDASRNLIIAGGLTISGTTTGVASSTSFTNVTNTTVTNTYLVRGGQAANTVNTGWIKIFIGTTAAWIPYWANATP